MSVEHLTATFAKPLFEQNANVMALKTIRINGLKVNEIKSLKRWYFVCLSKDKHKQNKILKKTN